MLEMCKKFWLASGRARGAIAKKITCLKLEPEAGENMAGKERGRLHNLELGCVFVLQA